MLGSLAQVLLSGLQIGSIYALMALSYYVIISATGILNFAQGEWMMVAGVLGLTLLGLGVPYPLAVLGSIAGAVMLALLSERLIIAPLQRRNASSAIILLALFGIMIVARYGTGILHGRLEDPLPAPARLARFHSCRECICVCAIDCNLCVHDRHFHRDWPIHTLHVAWSFPSRCRYRSVRGIAGRR